MATYKFGDADNNQHYETIPDGDYVFEVIDAQFSFSSGPKTAGSEVMTLTVQLFTDETLQEPVAQIESQLIFHQSCAWKIDTFVKASALTVNGHTPAKDEPIDFDKHLVEGLRGWCTVGHRTFKFKKGAREGQDGTANQIEVWLTDKPEIARKPVTASVDPFA